MNRSKTLFLMHLLLLSGLFFSTGSYRNWPYKIESDGKYYYQFLITMWFDADLDFSNNYAHPQHEFMVLPVDHYGWGGLISPTGRPENWFTTGPTILWLPMFALVYTLGWLLNQSGLSHIPLDGWSLWFQYGVMYAAVLYTMLTLWLIYDLLRPQFGRHVAFINASGLLWATPWLYYTLFEPAMSHTYDIFTLALLLWSYRRTSTKKHVGWYGLLGLVAGLHVLVRTQNVLNVLILLAYHGYQHRHNLPAHWIRYSLFSLIFFLSLLPLLLTNATLYGHPFAIPQGAGFLNWSEPQFYNLLLSQRNGLFSHHPVLGLGLLGLLMALLRRQQTRPHWPLLLPLLLIAALQIYLNATVSDWWAGHSFGQRRLVSSLLLFGVGGAYLHRAWNRFAPGEHAAVYAVLLFFSLMNLYLIYIHLFLWSYDEPHNIFTWMLHTAPPLLIR